MEYVAYGVLVLVVLIMCAFQQQRERAFDRERQDWAEERRQLLNRIQAPYAASIAAANEMQGAQDEGPVTEEQRLRRKAEAMGKSIEEFKIPPGWGGMTL